jgi:hypothetical protein
MVGLASPSPADITIYAGIEGSPDLPSGFEPPGEVDLGALSERRVFRLENGKVFIVFSDGTKFWVDGSGKRVWTTWDAPNTVEDMATYLLGPIIGYVLRLRGTVTLHASSFVTNGVAIALLGPAGAGKSTTVAALAERGFDVLADDVTVLKETPQGFWIEPAYPRLRLWPPSVEMLRGSRDALQPITPNWDKRDYRLDERGVFPPEAVPLGAIFCLSQRSPDETAPRIEPLSGHEKFVALVANTYGNQLLDSAMRRDEFDVLSTLVQTVPIKRLVPHSSPERLKDLCELIAKA